MRLANKIWEKHIDVFDHFDLTVPTGSLEEETKHTALFSAIVTLEIMLAIEFNTASREMLNGEVDYLKGSKYYSEHNKDSDY